MSFLLVLVIACGFVLYTFISTGYFRETSPRFQGEIRQKFFMAGAEDIAISRADSFLIISSDDRAARRDGMPRQGGLYLVDLTQRLLQVTPLTDGFKEAFYPHGISLLRLDSGKYQVLAINHVGTRHTIEQFTLYADSLVHERSLAHELMVSPNDVVQISESEFYFTNDHGYATGWKRNMEDYLGLAMSNVVYFDGEEHRIVAGDIAYANGINYDSNRDLLFVASPREFLVKVYKTNPDSSLDFIEDIKTGTGVDNIEFDLKGRLWIGCHPNLLTFAAYAGGSRSISPSEIITIDYRSKGDHSQESIFMDDGSIVSAATVAVPFGDKVFIGTVMDDEVVVWERR